MELQKEGSIKLFYDPLWPGLLLYLHSHPIAKNYGGLELSINAWSCDSEDPWGRIDHGKWVRPIIPTRTNHHDPLLVSMECTNGNGVIYKIRLEHRVYDPNRYRDYVDPILDGIINGFKNGRPRATSQCADLVHGHPTRRQAPSCCPLCKPIVVSMADHGPYCDRCGVGPMAHSVPCWTDGSDCLDTGIGGLWLGWVYHGVVVSGTYQLPAVCVVYEKQILNLGL